MFSNKTLYILLNSVLMILSLTSCSIKKPDLKKEQASTYHQMGNFTSKHSDYKRAANLYKKAYNLDPSKSNSLLALAKVQIMMGKSDQAVSTYHKVLRQDKNNKQAKQGLAAAYFTAGEPIEAAEQWQQSLNQDPKNIDALNGLGLVMEQLHHYKEAQACFKTALKSAPESSLLLNNLGLIMALQGEVPQGIEQLRAAQRIAPSTRLKNNINLLQSIASNEASIDMLVDKLNAAFPKQKSSVTSDNRKALNKYVQKWC